MAKVKFNWSLHLSANSEELEVWLNHDFSKSFKIEDEMFFENLADFFTEMATFQFMHDTPTNLSTESFLQLRQAYGKHENWRNR